MIKSSSSTIVQTKPEPQSPTLPQDGAARNPMPSTSPMPSRISGHDLMAIFPTNPPNHNISCDDLFKKQARQFLSTPEHSVTAAPPTLHAQGRRESPSEGAVNSQGWHRDTAPPNPHHLPLGPGHGNNGTEPRSRTWGSRPNTAASGHNTPSPGSHQETRRGEGSSSRGSSERRTKHSSESTSPIPLFTRQPLSLDRSRTSQ